MNAILRNRSLLIIAISESVSSTGSWVTMMAVFGLVVFRGQGGVSQSGLIYLAGLLPTLFFSPLAGWLCDRFDRKRLMIASELLSGLVVSGIIFVQSIELVYVLLALQAMTSSIMTPARQSSVPALVGREHLTQANALLQQLSSLIKIFGPVLAGVVLTVMNPHQAVILDVISYLLSAAILVYLPSLPPQRQTVPAVEIEPKQSWFAPFLDLFKCNPQLRLLFSMTFISLMSLVCVDILAAVYIRDVLQGGENFFGLVIGLIGLGTLVGAASLMLGKRPSRPWNDILSGLMLMAILPAAMAFGYQITVTLARILVIPACLLGGFGLGRQMVQSGTLLQTLSPAHLLGRMSGLFQSTTVAAQLIGTVLTPVLVPALVPTFTFFSIVAIMILGVVVFGLFSLRKSVWLPVTPGLPVEE